MSQFDTTLDGPESPGRKPAPQRSQTVGATALGLARAPIPGFHLAARPPPSELWYHAPSVPRGFVEQHTFPPPPSPCLAYSRALSAFGSRLYGAAHLPAPAAAFKIYTSYPSEAALEISCLRDAHLLPEPGCP